HTRALCSYSGPDDKNYYVYSDQNVAGPATASWTFFSNNADNDYLQPNGEFYVQREPGQQRNNLTAFYQSNANVMPGLLPAANDYCQPVNPTDNDRVLINREYFPNDVKQCYMPWSQDLDTNKQNFGIKEPVHNETNQSKLNVMVEDFKPSNEGSDDKRLQGTSSINSTYFKGNSRYPSNTSRQEKKYNNKKNFNYKPREEGQNQFYKRNIYGHSYHQDRGNKFQGNKYFANKYPSDRSSIRNGSTDALSIYTVNESIPCNSKKEFSTNVNERESLNVKASRSRELLSAGKETNVADGKNVPDNTVAESSYYYCKQPYGNHRNIKRYQDNGRYNREENCYKDKRRNYQGYGRENYNRDDKFKACGSNEFKECSNEETGSDTKRTNEKRHNHQGYYNEFREHKKDGRIDVGKEKGNEQVRSKKEMGEKNYVQKRRENKKSPIDDDSSQRERLTDQLNKGHLECLVCCEYIKQSDYVWSCSNCYHVLHLKCTKKWAKSSQAGNYHGLLLRFHYTADTLSSVYSCENVCGKLLECGNHACAKLCHPGDCEPCPLGVDKIATCCCGQTPLPDKRESCLDPVPTCDKICSKNLKCGQPNNPHKCKAKCHQGDCPACDLTTDVRCRCGNMDREIACKDLTTKADDARCEKRCMKKRSCGKHRCNQLCCIDIEHVCPLICSKTLSCGRHKCEQSCHKGRCQPCWRSSFEELYCECGASVTYPPVPCGTRRPACDRLCSRQHSCGHEVLHNCHSEPQCPPCTVLTQRWCHGKHELRKAVPCYISEISCGLPCNKPLSCGRHKCITICHPGPCEKPGQQCTQPCTAPREICGHICGVPCHEGKCPDIPCKEIVKVTCQCGHRTMSRVCAENAQEYQRIASSILASKMADVQLGHSINLEEVFGQGAKKQNQLKTLECNDECKIIERNRRLALGLQIANPDLSGKLMPRYSDFMKQWAKKDPHFCQVVHEKLTELVKLAKTSKQKSRSYSFDSMNKDRRHFIHESCEHFGCESQAYDQEPKRNVVATAVKDKCWLPSYSLLEIVQRENGQRKVPGPMKNFKRTILSLPAKKLEKPETPPSSSKASEPEIDYFDYQG
ncbi:transcriptional repressor NF-X1 homolog, partial [Ceratina calcarata]|uniref:Transcriptional repressor NF-X1 homolog n=1 Tax=Ceratina calcarata TaxID=156304 RepID=A0AAJ7SCY3_9HYME